LKEIAEIGTFVFIKRLLYRHFDSDYLVKNIIIAN